MDGDVALRNLHSFCFDVIRIAADHGGSARQFELSTAFGQLFRGLFACGDVASDAKQSHGSAVAVAQDRALDRNPALLCAMPSGERREAVFGLVATAGSRRRRKGSVEPRQIVGMDEAARRRKRRWGRRRMASVITPI